MYVNFFENIWLQTEFQPLILLCWVSLIYVDWVNSSRYFVTGSFIPLYLCSCVLKMTVSDPSSVYRIWQPLSSVKLDPCFCKFQDWTDYDEKVNESVGIYEVTHQFIKCWCHHVMSLRDRRMNTTAEHPWASFLASRMLQVLRLMMNINRCGLTPQAVSYASWINQHVQGFFHCVNKIERWTFWVTLFLCTFECHFQWSVGT